MRDKWLHSISGLLFITMLLLLGFFTVIQKKSESLALIQRISVRFPSVEGLKYGNPVFVKGLALGDVSDLKIQKDHIMVKITLRRNIQFYRDYQITLKNFSVFGKKAIYINPGREKFGPIPQGTVLQGQTIENPFDMASYVLSENRKQVKKIMNNIALITQKINESDGSLAQFINNPVIYNKTVKTLAETQDLLDKARKAYYRYRTGLITETVQEAIYEADG